MKTQTLIRELSRYEGEYQGHGFSHMEENFEGYFRLGECAQGNGLRLEFRALAGRDHVLHEEISLIGCQQDGRLCLFNLNSNNSLLLPHPLVRESLQKDGHALLFQYGDPEDKVGFREQIELVLLTDGSIRYTYSWGLPGEAFRERSSVHLKKL